MNKNYVHYLCTILASFVLSKNYAQENMSFIENNGQWLKEVKYKSDLNFGQIFFEENQFTFILLENKEHAHDHLGAHYDNEKEKIKGHHYQMQFINANENIDFTTDNQSLFYYH